MSKLLVATVVVVTVAAVPSRALADETDNFTCRNRPMRDALGPMDSLMNARIRDAIQRANRQGGPRCAAECLERAVRNELRESIGSSSVSPPTFIPHSRFMRSISQLPDLDRCHLEFADTIYGARPYNLPWLYPLHHRIIFVADSVRLANQVVGLDKLNHFIREGLVHWRAVNERGATITSDLTRELGPPRRQLAWTERGLKGMSLSGVLAYADLAASYSGFTFWSELLSVGTGRSFVGYDPTTGGLRQTRAFTFAAYVTDAWDEAINPSEFEAALRDEVEAAIRKRGLTVGDCRHLAALPDAPLYVNPQCLASAGAVESRD